MRSPALRRTTLVSALSAAAVLALAVNALAVSGSPIKVGEPLQNGPPAVAVDSAGTAYIAWADTANSGGAGDTVQYCTLPAGATGCAHSGTLTPAGGSGQQVDGVQVLADGSTVVLLADVYGVAHENTPEQEWTSTDGGATFNVVDGGASVADGILNADTAPVNALIVPGTDALGYAWVTAAGNPTFDEFPLSSPPPCSIKTCPAEERFSRLQPASSPSPLGNPRGVLASQLGANPGVLGVYETLGLPGASPCTFSTAYVYGSGDQSATNDYDKYAPGEPDSAWKVPLSPADCEVEYPAVGGGPSGFGVVEDDLTKHSTVYHPFDQTKDTFDKPSVTIADEPEQSASVSQDGAGGIYATYLGGAGGPIRLAYSSNGGATWSGPATINPNKDGSANSLTSSVGSSGQGWAAWKDGGSIIAQPFVATDTQAVSIEGSGSSSGATVTITVKCATSEPCTVTVTITATEVTIVIARAARRKVRRTRTVTLATGKFTIPGKGSKQLALHLTKAGKRLLAREHGHLKATVRVSEKTAGGAELTTRNITITAFKPKHKK